MDKYEYRVRAEQIKTLLDKKEFAEAMKVADTIDWRRVKSVSMLCTVSEIYKINRKYEESRDILLLAYERYPEGRMIVYALCELAIKMEEYVQAVEYLKEFVQIAPRDTGVYVLRYKLYEAQDVPLEERIEVLEEFKERDYRERWAYELAYLYHRIGLGTKCVEECDDIILWFGEGKYVTKAMELKMLHEPLTEEQRIKYEERNLRHVQPQAMQFQSDQSQVINDNEFEVKPMNMSKFSTINLQEELARNMQEFLTTEGNGEIDYAAPQEQYVQQESQYVQYGQPQEQYIQPEQQYAQYEQPQYGQSQEQYVQPEQQYAQYEQPQEQSIQPEQLYTQYEQPQEQYTQPEQPYTQYEQLQEQVIQPEQPYTQYEQPQEQSVQPEAQYEQPQEHTEQPEMQQDEIHVQSEQPDLPDIEELIARRDKLVQEMKARQEEKEQQIKIEQEVKVEKEISAEHEVKAEQENDIEQDISKEKEPEYDRMLAQELDGQISLSLPEGEMVDKQITGQICIEDVLKEWEAKKQDNAARRREEAKKKSLEQTNDILAQLVGVIPGIVAPQKPEPQVTPSAMESEIKQTSVSETKFAEEARAELGEEPIENAEPMTNQTPEKEPMLTIEEEIMQAAAEKQEEEARQREKENIAKGRTSEIKMAFDAQEKRKALEVTGKIPNIILPSATMKVEEESDEIEEIEEINQPEDIPDKENIYETEERTIEEPSQAEKIYKTEEVSLAEEVPIAGKELTTEEEPAVEEPIAEDYPMEEEMSEDVSEAGEVSQEEKKKKKKDRPSYMTLEEEPKSKRDFDPDEQRIFAPFDGIEKVKAQIVEAMETINMNGGSGNVLIMGSLESGRKEFAINMIKALQIIDTRFSGKVAKITGQALNKKDVKATITKLTGGALIIEEAGGLTKENMQILCDTLKNEIETMIVVLEDTKNDMQPLLQGVSAMKEIFNAKLDIPEYSNDDLVAYAKGYAKELEYSIDDLGILALYTRIGERQTPDHIVSLDEVKDIVDAAIKHVDKKNMSHFTDILFAKRYDDNDYIILREKDFITKK